MRKLRHRPFRVAVSECDASVIGHTGRQPVVSVPILKPVAVQHFAKRGVGRAGDKQRMPGGKRVVQVAWQSALLSGNEPANLGVTLDEDHRPASLCQFSGGNQAVDTAPDHNRISFFLHLVTKEGVCLHESSRRWTIFGKCGQPCAGPAAF